MNAIRWKITDRKTGAVANMSHPQTREARENMAKVIEYCGVPLRRGHRR